MKNKYTILYTIILLIMLVTIAYQSMVIVNQQSNIHSMQEDIRDIKQKYNAVNKVH